MFNFLPTSKSKRIAQFLAGGAVAALLSTGAVQAQNNFLDEGVVGPDAPKVSIRNLAPDTVTSWVPDRPTGDDFLPPAKGPGPVMSPKNRPYVPNGRGNQPTYRIADTSNPILQPWAKAQMEKANDDVRAGKVPYITRERCWPAGVPGFTVYTRVQPIHFMQTDKKITIVNELNTQVRHIYMNVPHSKNLKPTWYGESVGHYENGDTLVVDTIALKPHKMSVVDSFGTPHTEKLHVVERYRVYATPFGKRLELVIRVEDAGTFTMPWKGQAEYQQDRGVAGFDEVVCSENNRDFADGTTFGIISSTTEPFCGACDRARLTADGRWFTCLYATEGVDLKAPLRAGESDAELEALLRTR